MANHTTSKGKSSSGPRRHAAQQRSRQHQARGGGALSRMGMQAGGDYLQWLAATQPPDVIQRDPAFLEYQSRVGYSMAMEVMLHMAQQANSPYARVPEKTNTDKETNETKAQTKDNNNTTKSEVDQAKHTRDQADDTHEYEQETAHLAASQTVADQLDQTLSKAPPQNITQESTNAEQARRLELEEAPATEHRETSTQETQTQQVKTVATTTQTGNQTSSTTAGQPNTLLTVNTTNNTAPQMSNEAESAPQEADQTFSASSLPKDTSKLLNTLVTTQATDKPAALQGVQTASSAALQAQTDAAQAQLPIMPTPTGLPAKADDAADQKATLPPGQQPAIQNQLASAKNTESSAEEISTLVPETPANDIKSPTQLQSSPGPEVQGEQSGSGADPLLSQSAQNALSSIPTSMDTVVTESTHRPEVTLEGETDPGQLTDAQQANQAELQSNTLAASQQTQQNFGEYAIYPKADQDTLQAENNLTAVQPPEITSDLASPNLPAEALASINQQASPIVNEKLQQEQSAYDQGIEDYQQQSQQAHQTANEDINQLEGEARVEQTQAQQQAQNSVHSTREQWQYDIAQVQIEFSEQAAKAEQEHRQDIDREATAGTQNAQQHLADAEQKAAVEKTKADAKAQAEKNRAEEKSDGFWGWVKSKAKALIDGVKAVINTIYDGLRATVKFIFEAAKTLINAAIELARMAIVAIIHAFGMVLKGLLSIALAAFPKLREKALNVIDTAVESATSIVNSIAEGLKKAVSAVLDFLASTIDKLLGLMQTLFNGILTVMSMLISGELLEVMRRVGYLVEAAKQLSWELFQIAALEELMGANLDQDLSPQEMKLAGLPVPANAQAYMPPAQAGTATASMSSALPQEWTTDNLGVDHIAHDETLSAPLSAALMQQTGGDGVQEFGHSNDPNRSIAHFFDQDSASQVSPTHQAAAKQTTYSDGLSPKERASARWTIMKDALSKWFDKNWPYVLAAGILAIAGFIVATILTGGAILAAIPVILPILGYVFMGMLVAQIAGHLKDYLQKGWQGEIQPAAKSLAKALAAGAIELISWLTFKAGGLIVQGAKKIVKGSIAAGQTIAKGVQRTAGVIRRGSGAVFRQGKLILGGVKSGFARGAHTLDDLGRRLLERLKFKKFRIIVKGLRFRIEGYINPWVLLSTGRLKYVEQSDLRRVDAATGKSTGGVVRKGDVAMHDGKKVVVVGEKGSHSIGSVGQGQRSASKVVADLAEESSTVRRQKYREAMKDARNSSRVRPIKELLPEGKVPTIREGFSEWFDSLTLGELKLLITNGKHYDDIAAGIRNGGGKHEWLMVCEMLRVKSWRVPMSEIHRFTTRTLDLKWVHPATGRSGAHTVIVRGRKQSGYGSTTMHNELRRACKKDCVTVYHYPLLGDKQS